MKCITDDDDVNTLSRRRAVVLGGGHSTPFCAHSSSKNLRVSEDKGVTEKLIIKDGNIMPERQCSLMSRMKTDFYQHCRSCPLEGI